jgi:multidrug transporter EmrE-like cation transporter
LAIWRASKNSGERSLNWFVEALIYIASAALTAAGLILLREQLMAENDVEIAMTLLPPVAIYVTGLGLWLVAIVRNPLSVAYPIGVGLAMIASVSGGILFLDEVMSIPKSLGVLSILVGLYMVSRQSD